MTERDLELAETLRAALEGRTIEEGLATLRRDTGAHIIDAIKAVRRVRGISLGEAKRLVVTSRVWEDAVKAADPLHDDLESD